jgi:hypothetical protein
MVPGVVSVMVAHLVACFMGRGGSAARSDRSHRHQALAVA